MQSLDVQDAAVVPDSCDETQPVLSALDTSCAVVSELCEDDSVQSTFLEGVRFLARAISRSADSVVHSTSDASTSTPSMGSQSILETSELIQEYTRL